MVNLVSFNGDYWKMLSHTNREAEHFTISRVFLFLTLHLLHRSLSKELKSFVKSLQTQESWMIVQARRKREREDLMSQNPGFDPCFMKVWNLRPRVVGQSAALVLIVTTECWIHTEYNMIIISKLKARASRDCSRSGKKWLNNIHTDISILLNINNPSWKTQKYIPLCFIKNRFTFLYHLIPP